MPYNDYVYDDYEDEFFAEFGVADNLYSDTDLYDNSTYGGYEEEEEEEE